MARKDVARQDVASKRHVVYRLAWPAAGATVDPAGITFESKTLTIDHDPVSNIDDVNDRTKYMIGLLERALRARAIPSGRHRRPSTASSPGAGRRARSSRAAALCGRRLGSSRYRLIK
jgi:hypothetical protein